MGRSSRYEVPHATRIDWSERWRRHAHPVADGDKYRTQLRCTICPRTSRAGRVDVASIRTSCDDAVARAIAQMRCTLPARAG